ncbi:MAG: hypothetical protein LBQ88_01505 [Treponema sp.]|nr:hypothetical protein [Treponema sp.]
MKAKLLISAIFFIALLCFMRIYPHIQKPREGLDAETLGVFLENGDIICRMGNRIWSLYFCGVSPRDKRFSHLGIVKKDDTGIWVIHAEAGSDDGLNKVKETGLQEFLDIAKSAGIFRIKDTVGNTSSADRIAVEASLLQGRPFDWNFDLNDESAIYCTELLSIVLSRVVPDIKLDTVNIDSLNRTIIPLDSCYNPDYFIEIAYF